MVASIPRETSKATLALNGNISNCNSSFLSLDCTTPTVSIFYSTCLATHDHLTV